MSEWKEVIATDFCVEVTDGTHDSPKPVSKGRYLLTSKHLQEYQLDFANAYQISQEDYEKAIARSKVDQYDVLFSMIGTIGITHRVSMAKVDFAVKNMGIFKMGGDEIKSMWLYYWLKTRKAKEYINSTLSGTTQGYITLKALRNFPIQVPNEGLMKSITSFLSSLDDKIAVNRRICENLEAQAQALFKHWFIDFAPFKKGNFVESELGMIPEGLIYKRIGEMPHTLETGKRPSGGVKGIESGVPSIGAENIKGLGCYDYSKTKFVTEEYAASMKKGKINGYELLIYKDGGKPGYFIPNFAIFGEGYPYDEMCLNEHVFKLDFGNRGYSLFAYFFFKTSQIMSYLNAQGAKAAIPGINSKDIDAILMPSLENKWVNDYCNEVEDVIKQILMLSKESARLSTLRDTLLPKLMSGQIKVNKMEKSL